MWNNIYLVGPMGVGKTTVARELSKKLGVPHYDTDLEIERRSGVEISRIFDIEGESGFRIREKKVVSDLCTKQKIVMSTGGGVVLDKNSRKLLINNGFVIYLSAPASLLVERTRYDKRRPALLAAKDRVAFFSELLEKRDAFYREVADIIINIAEFSPKNIVDHIVLEL